jgi:hypothetical protein
MRRPPVPAFAALALLLASQAVAQCDECPLSFPIDPFPQRIIPKVAIGWNSQSRYQDSGLLGPMLVPIEIQSRDQDTMHILCAGNCTKLKTFGDWTIDWKVEGYDINQAYPFQQGSIVTPHADRVNQLTDRWAILYLPPEDLGLGQTRNIELNATIRDLCEKGADKDATVKFTGWVKRTTGGWEIDLSHDQPVIQKEIEIQCPFVESECELVGPLLDPYTPPSERYRDIPGKMFLDEVRAFTFAAEDLDRVQAECGIPTQPCSTFGLDTYCDEVSYSWTVTNVNSEDTGNGIVEVFGSMDPNSATFGTVPRGQTIMFSSTLPGKLRLVITATSKSGDSAVFTHDLEIFVRRTKYVNHADTDQHEIFVDGQKPLSYTNFAAAGLPPGVEWIDWTDDGDADDQGDQNFPMAYTRGKQPQLDFFAQIATETKSMPGAVLYGRDTTLGVDYAARLSWSIHIALPNSLFLWEPETFGNLPNAVGKHVHKVVWEVFYVPLRPPVHRPTHDYRVYTVLSDPNPVTTHSTPRAGELNSAIYRHWESAYDISCRAAAGAMTEAAVRSGLLAHYAAGNGAAAGLARKPINGINQPDGGVMRYWGEVASVPYGSTCSNVESMLWPLGAGIGRCGSMTQLSKLCLGVHGVDSFVSVFQASLPVRRLDPMNPPQGTIIPIPGARAWVDFLVKKYTFNPHTGDPGEIKYFDAAGALQGFTPKRIELDDDPDRKNGAADRVFYFFDKDRPHTAAWSRCTDVNGVQGVGADNPRSWFNNHALLHIPGGSYYDPSYGNVAPYATAAAYGAANLDGVAAPDLVPDGLPVGANGQCMFPIWTGADAPQFVLADTNL